MTQPITIDVWSDVVCPWCYIGKRNLETGIARYAESEEATSVEVVYRSFELSPDTPIDFDGTALDYLMVHRRVPEEIARQMIDRVVGVAKDVGLEYDYDSIQHTSTVKAHQVIHHARSEGLQIEMKERLLRAYFIEGRHIGLDDELAELATEVGLDRDKVKDALMDGRFVPAVRADQQQARDLGISGVPHFVFDMQFGLSGAQPPESFYRALVEASS